MKHLSYPLRPRPDSRDDKPPPFMGVMRVSRAYEASHIPAAILFILRMALCDFGVNSDDCGFRLIRLIGGAHGLLGFTKSLLHVF